MSKSDPLPTEVSLGAYELRRAFEAVFETLDSHLHRTCEHWVLTDTEGASALTEATTRLCNAAAEKFQEPGALRHDHLSAALERVITAIRLHGHDEDDPNSERPRWKDRPWRVKETVPVAFRATLNVGRRVLAEAVKVAIHGPEVEESLADRPARALNNELSSVQLAGRKFVEAMKRLEKARVEGEIPESSCAPFLAYARFDDPPSTRIDLDIYLETLAIDSFMIWKADRAIAAQSVLTIARHIVLARTLIDPAKHLTDDTRDPPLSYWSTRLRKTLSDMLEALNVGYDTSSWVLPLGSALGKGVVEAFEPILEQLYGYRRDLHAVDVRDTPLNLREVTMEQPKPTGLTAELLEAKIVVFQKETGLPLPDVALEVCLRDVLAVYATIPAWKAVVDGRADQRATRTAMLNSLPQHLRTAKELFERIDAVKQMSDEPLLAAPSIAIQRAADGMILLERAIRAVRNGGTDRLDRVLNPGAQIQTTQLTMDLERAHKNMDVLKLGLEMPQVDAAKLLVAVEVDQGSVSAWYERCRAVPSPRGIENEADGAVGGSLLKSGPTSEPKPGVWKDANWIRQAIRDYGGGAKFDPRSLGRAINLGRIPQGACRRKPQGHVEYDVIVVCDFEPCAMHKDALTTAIEAAYMPSRYSKSRKKDKTPPTVVRKPEVAPAGKPKATNILSDSKVN